MSMTQYASQQETLLRVIREHNGRFHQDDFDREFKGWVKVYDPQIKKHIMVQGPEPFPLVAIEDDPLGIGEIRSSHNKWLRLLHEMISEGTVRHVGIAPNIVYTLQEIA